MKILATFLLLLVINISPPVARSQDQQVVPYTLADRDRSIRLETRMEAIEAKMGSHDIVVGNDIN